MAWEWVDTASGAILGVAGVVGGAWTLAVGVNQMSAWPETGRRTSALHRTSSGTGSTALAPTKRCLT
jgi:hypothetical protein